MGKIVTKLLVEHFGTIFDYKFTALMEDELDKVEEGSLAWRHVLKEFYEPFKKQLDIASKEMKSVKKIIKETEYECDVCGKMMVIKWGRFGKFLACSGFPSCKYTAPIPTGIRCPEESCGGDLVKRATKNRRTFYGCSHYPKCRYVTNKLPKSEEE